MGYVNFRLCKECHEPTDMVICMDCRKRLAFEEANREHHEMRVFKKKWFATEPIAKLSKAPRRKRERAG